MGRFREKTKTTEYLVEQIHSRTIPLREQPPDEVRISLSPAFVIASMGIWGYG
jgi:hypothetical protein